MKIKVIKNNNWLTYQPSLHVLNPQQLQVLQNLAPNEILRDHHRSLVIKTEFENQQYVIKKPHNKNRSFWIRLTTLYRDSEVVRDLKSQLLLKSLNINTVTPVAALEKRKLGLVYDSTMIYKYKDGEHVSKSDFAEIIQIMNTLHRNGYVHDDPHIKNFLKNKNEVFVIDCKPRRNYFGQLGIAINNMTLARRTEGKELLYQLIGKNPEDDRYYRAANLLIDIQQFRRTIKNKMRKALGIEHKRNSEN